jgi:predicted oxidoreductase
MRVRMAPSGPEVFQLVGEGKVRHLGVSNFTPSQFDMLASRLPVPLVTNQVELHPLRLAAFQDGTLDQCMRARISPMAWSPLAGGRLVAGQGDAETRVRAVLVELARKYGAEQEQLLLAWLLRHPSRIIPVVGTNRPERITAAVGALALEMELQDWFALWSAALGSEVP